MMNITIEDGECIISGIDYNGYAFELRMYSSEWHAIREHIETEAVLADRKRVWDILSNEIAIASKQYDEYVPPEEESDTTEDVLFGRWAGLYDLRMFRLFPEGEPKPEKLNPPVGDRQDSES